MTNHSDRRGGTATLPQRKTTGRGRGVQDTTGPDENGGGTAQPRRTPRRGTRREDAGRGKAPVRHETTPGNGGDLGAAKAAATEGAVAVASTPEARAALEAEARAAYEEASRKSKRKALPRGAAAAARRAGGRADERDGKVPGPASEDEPASRAGAHGDAGAATGRPAMRDERGGRERVPLRERAGRWARSVREFAAAHPKGMGALVAVVVAAAMLYGPASDYYVSMRTNEDLSAQYASVKSDNEDLQSEVDALMTPEGIQDKARELGYVMEGETAVTVEGLDDSSSSDQADPSAEPTYEDTRAWYTKVLDFLFGYDPKEVLG